MTEETTNPVEEIVDTPEVTEDDTSSDELDNESSSVDDDSEEVEHDGEKYKIPKALKSALMFQADYTRKTQEVAEQRKAVEYERERFTQDAEAHRADIHDYARLVAVDDRLKQFEQVNWNELSANDPVQAQQLWIQHSQLKDARQALAGTLTQRQQQRNFETQQKSAKQLEEGRAAIAREIKDWSPELAGKLREFALSDGWSEKEIDGITAAQVKSLHRSFIGAQLLSKQTPKAPSTAPAKPVTKVGSNASVRKEPSKMTDSEFAEWRRSQIKNRK